MKSNAQKLEFHKLIHSIALTYHAKMSDDVIAIYEEILEEFDIDEIKKAALEHMKKSEWMPKPAELLRIIKTWREATQKKIEHSESDRLAELREIEFEISHAQRILSLEQSDKILWTAELEKSKAKLRAFAGQNAEVILANMAAKATATHVERPEAQHQRGLTALAKILGDLKGKIPSG